ncbi:unnamed protein product [Trichogramma brassicae]|uniref:Glycosylphosphatidylinositol anchor attachment 1 protein n=1 Tax=Trichogramma brassicae TaxID=86971 RepID=A0A6H5II37_9HYME|nr:unnamed protein product [Trichogramma brassicae]
MGLLTDPKAGNGEMAKFILRWEKVLCYLLYFCGIIWMMCLAHPFFNDKQRYWAKDIIFLVTEHEQLGMQAWLDAYHNVVSGHEGILLSGDLAGRAGSIQAAINLELHSMAITSIDVKIEGLNGQLPNLDLFNLAQNMISKEGIRRSFQRRFDTYERDPVKKWSYHFNTLMSMIMAQSTGIPNGNHGLFHRFGIEAITLEGFDNLKEGAQRNFYNVGRIVESIVRSVNNLLERFHQSFFFYLLTCTDRYISIGEFYYIKMKYVSKSKYSNTALVCVITCVEFGTALTCIAMHNFSLAFLTAVVYVPIVLSIYPKQTITSRYRKILNVIWPLLHPFSIITIIVFMYGFINYRDETIMSVLVRSLKATKQAFVLSIFDSMIYGNMLYSVTVAIMLPIWLLYWNIIHKNTEINT